MASGIRLYHPTIRSSIYLVEQRERPYRIPFHCSTCCVFIQKGMPHTLNYFSCGGSHLNKTYHLQIDDAGRVIVSKEIFQRLLKMEDMAGFLVDDEILNPPDQVLGGGGKRLKLVEYKIPKSNNNGKGG